MTITTHKTFCRYCHAYCPMDVDVEENTVKAVRPDITNPMYGGYTCIKGRQLVEQMYQPQRLTAAQKKVDGRFTDIDSETALDEIAAQLKDILEQHGPRAIATYNGTYAFQNSGQLAYSRAWHNALGSPSYYTSVTIDQPAKVFCGTRHGYWGAGTHYFNDSDVAMVIGNNPMVSQYAPPGGVPSVSPFEKLREAKKRGLKLIAVDPRSTELTRRSDLHLQIKPGEDSTLLAGMIRLILEENLHDAEFCDQYTEGLEQLRAEVQPYTLDYVAGRTDLAAEHIAEAARLFAAGPRGVAITGTGPEMSDNPNLTQHLVASLNSLCGRYYREGETMPNPGVLAPAGSRKAQPSRVPLAWSHGAKSRINPELGELTAQGMMGPVKEMPTNLLADEILTPGEGQVRALIVVGGNPLLAFANQEKAMLAMQELDLLVCIDPYMSATAELADYIFAPKLTLERDDVTLLADPWYEVPYSHYAETVVATDHDVVEEWEVYWGLAHRLGLDVIIGSQPISNATKPSKFELLSAITHGSRVPLEWLRDNPGGHEFPEHSITVAPADPSNTDRLQFYPDGLAEDFAEALNRPDMEAPYSHRLICSRSKYVLNSSGLNLDLLREKMGTTNPAYLHSEDIAELGMEDDCLVEVHSADGSILAVLSANDRIKRGVIAMHHSWGGLPGAESDARVREIGTNTNKLIDNLKNTQRYTGMAQQSAIPVYITRKEEAA
jgi:anaerobic selenocysteine-containing dehydrogenase